MPETPATVVPTAPVFPPGRYGRRRAHRTRRPWLLALLVAVLLVTMGGIAFRLYRMYGDPTYDAQVITYTGVTESQVVIDFRVTVPTGGSAICVVQARSRDGAVVGREEVRVVAEPGERHPVARHRLATTGRPIIGEVLRCRAPD
ncbi:DUF4307 domain-containing protein [Plantactinospora sp. CA-290183]|uniref:DUF4307 domain-containing protein n=1 Tax=Plantactinospora sp. CA-290183 TaxID=3240006 RepID=UPI003D89E217